MKKKAVLLYPVGQRDMQILRSQENDNSWVFSPLPPKTLADTCDTLIELKNDASCADPQFAPITAPKFSTAREAFFQKEADPVDIFLEGSGAYLCFPIFERVLKKIVQSFPDYPLQTIILFNTNRQNLPEEAERLATFAQKEPFCFPDFMKMALPALWACIGSATAVPEVEEVTVLRGENITRQAIYHYFEEIWLPQYGAKLQQADLVFLAESPGIPSIGQAISTFASVIHTADKLVLLEKEENEVVPRIVPVYEHFYRDRHALIGMLESEDFIGAQKLIQASSFIRAELLAGLIDLAVAKLEIKLPAPLRKEIQERFRKLMAMQTLPAWTDLGSENEDVLEKILIKIINSCRRRRFDEAGTLMITACEIGIKRAIELQWPGTIREDKRGEKFHPDALPDTIRNELKKIWNCDEPFAMGTSFYYDLLEMEPDVFAPLLDLLDKTRDLRKARNRLLHQGQGIDLKKIRSAFNVSQTRFNTVNGLLDSKFASTLLSYLDNPDKGLRYWPTEAAEAALESLKMVSLKNLFSPTQ